MLDKAALAIKVTVVVIASVLVLYGSFRYAGSIELFGLHKVIVSGASLIENDDVMEAAEISFGSSLFRVPVDSIQQRILSHPYVEAVQVSRQFPRSLFIQVRERTPIAYLNHGELSCVDQDGVVLPTPQSGVTLSLPVLSGFGEQDSIVTGKLTVNERLLHMVESLVAMRENYPTLYSNISEFVARDDEYVIYTSDSPMEIYLGQTDLTKKIFTLKAFWATVGQHRDWDDYDYIDLRFAKQVIVRERT